MAYCASLGCRMKMSVQQPVECLAWEIGVLGENLSQCRCVDHKSHVTLRAPNRVATLGNRRLTALIIRLTL
jgi:hypothetical protein